MKLKKIIINSPAFPLLDFIRQKYFVYRRRKDHLKVGRNVHIPSNCKFGKYNVICDNVNLFNAEIGDYTYISSGVSIASTKIGKFCSIGPNLLCGLGKHPSKIFVSSHPIFYSTKKQSQTTFADKDYFSENVDIRIGNDVWIGAHVIILDGVSIGDGAIIGAGAVVTKDVEPYAVVGGVPAKVIRYRFAEDQINKLLEIKWWNKDVKWLEENFRLFHDINIFLENF